MAKDLNAYFITEYTQMSNKPKKMLDITTSLVTREIKTTGDINIYLL